MKKLFGILLILIALNFYSKTISIRGLYNRNFHMKYEESSDPIVPEQFQYTAKIPGVGWFYDNNQGFDLEVTYYPYDKVKEMQLLLLCGFSYQRIKSSEEVANYVFGEKINASKIFFNIGSGQLIDSGGTEAFWFFSLGPVLNFYKGETIDDGVQMIFDYAPSMTFQFYSGFEIPLEKSVSLNLSMKLDLGNIKRGDLNFYSDNTWLAKAEPIGENDINDDQFVISAGISWDYKLGGKK